MNDIIVCPYCRYIGAPITKQKKSTKKYIYICPQCGNAVTFRRKK